jgi:hypothetical protein
VHLCFPSSISPVFASVGKTATASEGTNANSYTKSPPQKVMFLQPIWRHHHIKIVNMASFLYHHLQYDVITFPYDVITISPPSIWRHHHIKIVNMTSSLYHYIWRHHHIKIFNMASFLYHHLQYDVITISTPPIDVITISNLNAASSSYQIINMTSSLYHHLQYDVITTSNLQYGVLTISPPSIWRHHHIKIFNMVSSPTTFNMTSSPFKIFNMASSPTTFNMTSSSYQNIQYGVIPISPPSIWRHHHIKIFNMALSLHHRL